MQTRSGQGGWRMCGTQYWVHAYWSTSLVQGLLNCNKRDKLGGGKCHFNFFFCIINNEVVNRTHVCTSLIINDIHMVLAHGILNNFVSSAAPTPMNHKNLIERIWTILCLSWLKSVTWRSCFEKLKCGPRFRLSWNKALCVKKQMQWNFPVFRFQKQLWSPMIRDQNSSKQIVVLFVTVEMWIKCEQMRLSWMK